MRDEGQRLTAHEGHWTYVRLCRAKVLLRQLPDRVSLHTLDHVARTASEKLNTMQRSTSGQRASVSSAQSWDTGNVG